MLGATAVFGPDSVSTPVKAARGARGDVSSILTWSTMKRMYNVRVVTEEWLNEDLEERMGLENHVVIVDHHEDPVRAYIDQAFGMPLEVYDVTPMGFALQ